MNSESDKPDPELDQNGAHNPPGNLPGPDSAASDIISVVSESLTWAGAVQRMAAGICILDDEGKIRLANPAMQELLSTDLNYRGLPLIDCLAVNDPHKLGVFMHSLLRGRQSSTEIGIRGKGLNDSSYVISSIELADKSGAKFYCLMFTDISDIRVAETEKLALMERILRQRHQENLGTLAGGLSHEINNILQVIRMQAESCQQASNRPAVVRHRVQEIIESTFRAERMLRQLLAFSRSSMEDPTEIRLSEVVRRIISLASLRNHGLISFELDIQVTNDEVLADEAQIEQVISQLVGNGIQALPAKGGTLSLRLRDATHSDLERLQDNSDRHSDYILLEVEDNGSGIPGEVIDRIFDPFFTTREVGQGTGLGLSMAQGIVNSHKGAIWAVPGAMGGTCMRVLLKRSSAKTGSSAEVRESMPRVMIVDDKDVNINVSRRMLELAGLQVVSYTDSDSAREILLTEADSVSVLVIDRNLPGLNGMELAGIARSLNPSIRIILCIGYMPDIDVQQADSLGIDAVLAKPFDAHELLSTVLQMISRGSDPGLPYPNIA